MRGAVMYGPGHVRVEERAEPRILAPTDAILRLPATCICGSDLWPWRGDYRWPSPMGHEYAGIVEEVGSEVRTIRPGQFVVGSFPPPTTPARSAGRATRAPASTASPSAPGAPRPSCSGSRSPTARSSRHRRHRPRS